MIRIDGWRRETLCVLILTLLWLIFFWRLFTPVLAQQAALVPGDFSDQFVTFGAYQYARFSAGEVPLWNPYNNGGMPFIADTQAAAFYPPRLATIALANWSSGWTYHALELEMTFHVLFYVLALYALVRRMTLGARGSHVGGLIAALVGGFGGYMTGYPPLQLALLEAGVWLPLGVLGVFEATRTEFRWRPLLLTGLALGLSWMAGHPQTSFFLTYLLVAFFAFRVIAARLPVLMWLGGTLLFGLMAVALVAVTLFPGLEYLIQTSRAGFDFDELSHGFPMRDLLQLFVPGVFSQWSPLWVGLGGLGLALIAVVNRVSGARFWGAVALFALVFSLGGNGPLYPALFDLIPGLRFFRGQERAAYLVANSMAILAGLGACYWTTAPKPDPRRVAASVLGVTFVLIAIKLIDWQAPISAGSNWVLAGSAAFALLWAALLPTVAFKPQYLPLLVAAIALELFGFGFYLSTNYAVVQPETLINRNPLIDAVRLDTDVPFRVDGARVLRGNWGSYYQIADIQGISPLFLKGPQEIIESGLPDERAWELLSVRYVYSDWSALNVPSELVVEGSDSQGLVNLHRLTAQRPFAHLVYDAVVVNSDEEARQTMADVDFNPRTTVILHTPIPLDLPMSPIEYYGSTVTRFSPETVEIDVETPDNAILSLAQVDYPGWRATIDGQSAQLVRAYGGLAALAMPAGHHTVTLVYDPLTYRIGALVSAATWLSLAGYAVWLVLKAVSRRRT